MDLLSAATYAVSNSFSIFLSSEQRIGKDFRLGVVPHLSLYLNAETAGAKSKWSSTILKTKGSCNKYVTAILLAQAQLEFSHNFAGIRNASFVVKAKCHPTHRQTAAAIRSIAANTAALRKEKQSPICASFRKHNRG